MIVGIILCFAIACFNMQSVTGLKLPNGGNLPAAMTSNKPGTWAFDTMSRRVITDILPRIIADNAEVLGHPSIPQMAESFLQLNDLKSSLECGNTGYLRGTARGHQ